MSLTFISLLDSLTQTALFVNGDINITFAGGSVDWFGICALLIVLSVRKH